MVAYESDLAQVRSVLIEMIDKLDWRSQVLKPDLYLREFGSSSINYLVCVWIDDANDSLHRTSDLPEAAWRRLKEAGIIIAFPQLDLQAERPSVPPDPTPKDEEYRRATCEPPVLVTFSDWPATAPRAPPC